MLPLGVNAPGDCAIAIVALPKGAETRRIRNRAQKDTVTLLVVRCTTNADYLLQPILASRRLAERSSAVGRNFSGDCVELGAHGKSYTSRTNTND